MPLTGPRDACMLDGGAVVLSRSPCNRCHFCIGAFFHTWRGWRLSFLRCRNWLKIIISITAHAAKAATKIDVVQDNVTIQDRAYDIPSFVNLKAIQ
jgi:uncharacterized membrane protein